MPNPDQIPYVKLIKDAGTPDEISDIPIIGNIYNTANAVIDFAESGCNPNWNVYVRTLWPVVGELVLVLLTFDQWDVLRGYFRPAGGRGLGGLGRASRRQRRLTKAQRARGLLRGGIPEIGDEIGKHLPGATTVKGRPIGAGQAVFWKIDGLAQRGLWWWMVADITEDFAVNWTSAILESEECQDAASGGFQRSGPNTVVNSSGAWSGILRSTIDETWGGVTGNDNGIAALPDMQGVMIWSATITQFVPGTSGSIALAIEDANTGQRLAESSTVTTADGMAPTPISVTARFAQNMDVRWVYRTTGDAVDLNDGIANVFTYPT